MAWTNLPTNFKNLIWSGLKKYRQYTNQDNTVSFEDVTEYVDTEGTQMSAAQLNQMTGAINHLMTEGILYYSSAGGNAMTVNAATNAQIGRIPASGTTTKITTDTVVLNIEFANPAAITSKVTWTSYNGYITFSGTCTSATTANVILGQKGN